MKVRVLRDYVVVYEQKMFGVISYPKVVVRATNAREAASDMRRAGYRPIIGVYRKDEE